MRDFQKNLIHYKKTTKEALKKINTISDQYPQEPLALFAIDDDGILIGTFTDGDIRRSLLNGKSIEDPVEEVMNTDFSFLRKESYSLNEVNKFCEKNIKLIPILDKNDRPIKIIDLNQKKTILPVDAMIMAGGKGTRLRPLTEDTPKPLIEIGGKPIIEYNIDRLNQYGIDNLVLSVNYLGEQLVNYFGDGSSKEMEIRYVHETKPLGTIGSVSLVDKFHHENVLLMNSDLLTTIDYYDFYKDFLKKDADMAVASIPYDVKIPYAVLETNGEGITSFKEKPEYTYYSNAGIYLIKKELLKRIPKGEFVDVTDFMESLISDGKKVTYFPILGYWLDIGRHEDLEKAKKDIQLLRL